LIVGAGSAARRLRLGLVLALGLFQLENYENFLWSGSSIDHFQVLLYVGATVAALAQGTRTAWFIAGLCAVLATLTLAHGLLVWPLGAAILWRARRSPARCSLWAAVAVVTAEVAAVRGWASPRTSAPPRATGCQRTAAQGCRPRRCSSRSGCGWWAAQLRS
jgi:hypothetical protein